MILKASFVLSMTLKSELHNFHLQSLFKFFLKHWILYQAIYQPQNDHLKDFRKPHNIPKHEIHDDYKALAVISYIFQKVKLSTICPTMTFCLRKSRNSWSAWKCRSSGRVVFFLVYFCRVALVRAVALEGLNLPSRSPDISYVRRKGGRLGLLFWALLFDNLKLGSGNTTPNELGYKLQVWKHNMQWTWVQITSLATQHTTNLGINYKPGNTMRNELEYKLWVWQHNAQRTWVQITIYFTIALKWQTPVVHKSWLIPYIPLTWAYQNQHTGELISAQKLTHAKQQRSESPMVTLTWRMCKYKIYKLKQRYMMSFER